MSNSIWKFILVKGELQHISMPKGAKILAVQTQDGVPCIWAFVDLLAAHEWRDFRIAGTGFSFDDLRPDQHVGTFQQGPFVWHLFDVTKGI